MEYRIIETVRNNGDSSYKPQYRIDENKSWHTLKEYQYLFGSCSYVEVSYNSYEEAKAKLKEIHDKEVARTVSHEIKFS